MSALLLRKAKASEVEAALVKFAFAEVEVEMTGYLGDPITKCLEDGRFYEESLLEEVLKRYGTGGVYVDFGAFIGTHTVFFAKFCKADLVIAVEPYPMSFAMLNWNLEHNEIETVESYCVAVGKESDRGELVHDTANYSFGGTNLVLGGGSIPVIRAGALITVAPKLVKIDVESSVVDVLEGCMPEIERYHPVMVVEHCCGRGEDITRILRELGYARKWTYNGGGPDTVGYEYKESI